MFIIYYVLNLIIKPITYKLGQALPSSIYKELRAINKNNRNNPRWENEQRYSFKEKDTWASNHMKSCPTSLIIFKMMMKTRVNYYL